MTIRSAGITAVCIHLILLGVSNPASAEPGNGSTFPEAPGYGSRAEVMARILTGQLKLIGKPDRLPADTRLDAGVVYGTVGDRELEMDIVRPDPADADRAENTGRDGRPALLFIHGGAWAKGSREDYYVYTHHFASLGYVCATASYRLVREAPFPAAVKDVKCAIRFLRSHAGDYGIDPEKIAVVGGSAGGHLAMMAAYTGPEDGFDDSGGHAGISSHVSAVVDFYGPADLTTDFAVNAGAVKAFLDGVPYSVNPQLYRQASPVSYLDAGDPPTLIFHGTLDEIVPVNQSNLLAARLRELEIDHYYDRLEGWPHTMDAAVVVNNRTRAVMEWFLRQHLGDPTH